MPRLTGSFTIPLDLAAPHARVWAFFAELPTSGDQVEAFENRPNFYAIATNERIVSSYEAVVGGILRWVALVTVDLSPNDDGGTRFRLNGLVAATADGA